MSEDVITTTSIQGRQFSPEYKRELFHAWVRAGEPPIKLFYKNIKPDSTGRLPTYRTLIAWLADDEFAGELEEIKEQVDQQLRAETVNAKVKAIERHAETGQTLQKFGMDWLREHLGELTATTALRAIALGYEMELASVGVPEALKKIFSKSDDDLMKEIAELAAETTVTEDGED